MKHDTMRLGELRDLVEDAINVHGEDLPVYAVCDYGDHCHTQQLVKLLDGKPGVATKTAYSSSGLALDEDTSPDDCEAETKIFVL